jgi:hypothetical protein
MRMVRYAPPAVALFLALTGCSGSDTAEGGPAAPSAALPPPGHQNVGSFVMHVQPKANRIDLRRLPPQLEGEPRIGPENFNNLPIVSDGTTGSGPANTTELATLSTTDTYNSGASGSCPANSYCGDVQLMHFYSGLNLSAVYVQVTAITTTSGQNDTTHKVTNGVSSTPFGIGVSLGAWQYTSLPGSLAASTGSTKTWAFANPDDADFYVYLNVLASYYPMLWFDTAGITQTASLVAGQPAVVHYNYARNGNCRGNNWSMQGYLKGANIDIHTTSWTGSSTATYFDQIFTMPFGSGVAFWFDNTDSTGCNKYDSNNSANFNYPITGSTPAIHFSGPSTSTSPYPSSNWNVYADSGVKGGATITVDYELDRIQCMTLDQYGRVAAGTHVNMGYTFDSTGVWNTVSMVGTVYGDPQGGQILVPPAISIPSGSHKLTVYFSSDAPSCGSGGYDSNFGNNYVFNY